MAYFNEEKHLWGVYTFQNSEQSWRIITNPFHRATLEPLMKKRYQASIKIVEEAATLCLDTGEECLPGSSTIITCDYSSRVVVLRLEHAPKMLYMLTHHAHRCPNQYTFFPTADYTVFVPKYGFDKIRKLLQDNAAPGKDARQALAKYIASQKPPPRSSSN